MEEIKINKAWYKGLIREIGRMEQVILSYQQSEKINDITILLVREISHLKGYAESLQTQFGDEQLRKS